LGPDKKKLEVDKKDDIKRAPVTINPRIFPSKATSIAVATVKTARSPEIKSSAIRIAKNKVLR